jgi:hypothetical protein
VIIASPKRGGRQHKPRLASADDDGKKPVWPTTWVVGARFRGARRVHSINHVGWRGGGQMGG